MNEQDKNKIKNLDLNSLGEILYLLDKSNYKEEPVTIRQFYEDDFYLAKSFNNVYKYWQEILDDIYPNPFYSPYYEIILSAGTGTGKTTLSTIGLLYDMYRLGCLKDPRGYYGLDQTTKIVFGLFSANLTLAGDVNWSKICEALLDSPWFDERMMDRRGLKKKAGSLNLVYVLDNIGIQMGSRFQHTMGKAIFGALLDEASFQQDKSQQAQKTYSELSNRMASRFVDTSGCTPGHLWLASSPKDATDFLQERIDKSKGIQGIKIVNNVSSWHVKPSLLEGGTFSMFIGNTTKDARVIEEGDKIEPDEEPFIIDVPNVFKDRFRRDPLISIMNLAGIRTVSDIALLRSVQLINDSMVLDNPFTKDVIQLPFKEEDGQIMDYINYDYFNDLRHPESNRFIHLDAAYSSKTLDRFGIASVYAVLKDKNLYSEFQNGRIINFETADKFYYVDFAIAIEPLKGQEVSLKKVENFIKYLIKILNYPVASISADTFQSKRTLQELELSGYETSNISVDRNRDYYLFLKDCINNRDIVMPRHELLKTELTKLRDDGIKVDHPLNGTKDVADAVCGALSNCKSSKKLINSAKIASQYLREIEGLDYSEIDFTNKDELEALDYISLEQNKNFFAKFFN